MYKQQLREERNNITDAAHIYQKAMNSIALAYRAIYFINLNQNEFCVIHPKKDSCGHHCDYSKAVEAFFASGKIHPDFMEDVNSFLEISNIKKGLRDKDYIEYRYLRKDADDSYEWCLTSITAAERDGDDVITAAMSVRSIDSMVKKDEEQKEHLVMAVERADAANSAKSDFLSCMSHDIRTPMNAILGMTSVAAMHVDDKERVMDSLNKIMVSGKHLLGLIDEVLDMSKIESGKVSLVEEDFNLSDIIDGLLTLFNSQIIAKKINFNVSIENVKHEDLIGDNQRLQQIFVNILSNAVKYTPDEGSITLSIREKSSDMRGKGCFEFIFEDNGIGMEQDFVDRIFEPFARAKDSRTGTIEGTGLGMAIAVNIARMMNGDIQVESELNHGSKFTVTVYIKIKNISDENSKEFADYSAFVIDDDESLCQKTCAMLESLYVSAEYSLDVNSGVQRLNETAKKNFCVAVVDCNINGKSGQETVMEIRKAINDNIPVIFMCDYGQSQVIMDVGFTGANVYIEKPLFRTKLVYALRKVLGIAPKAKPSVIDSFKSCNFEGKKILLVDDNELNSEVSGELLSVVGIEVDKAFDGKQAVDKVNEMPPGFYDLIFMDVQMPNMNGYEAAKAIRSLGREDLKTIPIIAMTADAFTDDIRKAKEAGMNGHISKPVELAKLEETLNDWI